MAEVKMRLNLNAMEVELVVDGQVALSSGSDVFKSWVEAANKLNAPPTPEPVLVEAPVQEKELVPETPVLEEVPESPVVETPEVTPKDEVVEPVKE